MLRNILRAPGRSAWPLVAGILVILPLGCSSGSSTPQAPFINIPVANQNVLDGEKATFTVAAQGQSPLSFQWRKNGVAINGTEAVPTNLDHYIFSPVYDTDNGALYDVVISNALGSLVSNQAKLTIGANVPLIATQPLDQPNVKVGDKVELKVTVKNSTPINFQWLKDSQAVSGATSATYTIQSAQSSDTGKYKVTLSNAMGTVTSNEVQVTVQANPAVQLLGNPGFEDGANQTAWIINEGGDAKYLDDGDFLYEPTPTNRKQTHTGAWLLYLGNLDVGGTCNVYQDVVIPANATKADFSFWLVIQNTGSANYVCVAPGQAVFKAQILNPATKAVLATLVTKDGFTDGLTGPVFDYTEYKYDLLPYKGQTVRIYFTETEVSGKYCNFLVDDTALTVLKP